MFNFHQPPQPLYQDHGASASRAPPLYQDHGASASRASPLYQDHGASASRASSSPGALRSSDITLHLRQQPKEALVTAQGKEKTLAMMQFLTRSRHFLQSPYLFMCVSLYKLDKDETLDGSASNKALAGSLVSSLHRLKDVTNKDGGFFVFGDISIRMQGSFRLHFSLFELRKELGSVQYLGNITSEPFKVLLPKDFKGMDESTYLSRAFSDQGVRLRLRKEPRAMMGHKRQYGGYVVDQNEQDKSQYTYTVDQNEQNKRGYPYANNQPEQNKRVRIDNSDDFRAEQMYPPSSLPTGSTLPTGSSLHPGSSLSMGSSLHPGSSLSMGSSLHPGSSLSMGSSLHPGSSLSMGSSFSVGSSLPAGIGVSGYPFDNSNSQSTSNSPAVLYSGALPAQRYYVGQTPYMTPRDSYS
ncbi:hypothetical protein EJ04DRAFT_524500 [Polyplosphaeria fusca]|uniref:Velvet domain-containing protein n=1 Tax=Polyplosphaeria fusca TaxID=682080 RepID=A0A9P4V0G1_9PLEO|nr:hypothetical protein EJ04DRAFT_524500 [Polyplosphaeria fusca]